MELETINKLYLELGQIATAKNNYTLQLEQLIRCFSLVVDRKGKNTDWDTISDRIIELNLCGANYEDRYSLDEFKSRHETRR